MSIRALPVAASFAFVLALGACTKDGATGSGGGGSGPGTDKASYSYTFTTAPGQETHWCQYTKLPDNAGKGSAVTSYSWSWQNAHHWALYQTTADLPANVELDKPFDCFQPGAMKYAKPASLLLAVGEKGEQKFPQGTGFIFKPGEIVIVQTHTLNTTSADIQAKLDITLNTVDPATVPNPLGLIQFYDPYIVVPPHTAAKAAMRCKIPQDITVLYGTTHEHSRGTAVNVFLDEGDARATSPFLTTTDWEHPALADTFEVKAGSHIRTECDYMGDDKEVTQGQFKDTAEMCMFYGYYYPVVEGDNNARGLFENCVQDSFPSGVGDEYGVGTTACSDSLACIQACDPSEAPNPGDGRIDVGPCWQKCLVNSCPSASEPLNQLGYCVQTNCAAECAPGGDCATCVISKCKSQFTACNTNKCAAN